MTIERDKFDEREGGCHHQIHMYTNTRVNTYLSVNYISIYHY